VEIGQHDAKSTGHLPGSRPDLISKVTDFFRFAVGDE